MRARRRSGDADQALAQLVEAGRLQLIEHLAAALLAFVDYGGADPLDGAGRRGLLALELGKQQQCHVELANRAERAGDAPDPLLRAIQGVHVGAGPQHRQCLA